MENEAEGCVHVGEGPLMLGEARGARRRDEEGGTDAEMAGWRHQRDAHESQHAPGVGGGQGGLACCRPCAGREPDAPERPD